MAMHAGPNAWGAPGLQRANTAHHFVYNHNGTQYNARPGLQPSYSYPPPGYQQAGYNGFADDSTAYAARDQYSTGYSHNCRSTHPFSYSSNQWVPHYRHRAERLASGTPINIYTFNLASTSEPLTHLSEAFSTIRQEVRQGSPTIINFQGCDSNVLRALLMNPQVQRQFQVTDITPAHRSTTFTTTLATLDLCILRVFRLAFSGSRSGRDALFVDVELEGGGALRVANTQLGNHRSHYKERKKDLSLITRYLHSERAAVLGGDVGTAWTERSEHSSRGGNLHDATGSTRGANMGGFGLFQNTDQWGREEARDKILYRGEARPLNNGQGGVRNAWPQNNWGGTRSWPGTGVQIVIGDRRW